MTPDSVASFPLPSRRLLPNGLGLRFIQLPAGNQAAALVRVQAGSHDAPAEYPGLAHFLEHLLFLGSKAYAATESLMPFVQGRAGQLNASTRERHTDFFFQVSTDTFDEALKRLLDMLARPLLDEAAQLREREVLQAEFLARERDRETLCDAAIGTALTKAHPFSAFHAGNRATLPVETPAFQQALKGYHQRFYHGGQMELLVAAPFEIEHLLDVLECVECQLPAAPAVVRRRAPLLADDGATLRLSIDGAPSSLELAFALDGLPDEACIALDVLGAWLASHADGSLSATLREAGWCDGLALRVPYWHDGQGVIVISMVLTEQGMTERAQLAAAVRSWLQFMTLHAPWPSLWDEYVQIRQRGLKSKGPLALLRDWVDPATWQPTIEADRIRQALQALGTQLEGGRPIILTVDSQSAVADKGIEADRVSFSLKLASERLPEPVCRPWQWQFPPRNPWLSERLPPQAAPVSAPGLTWLDHVDVAGQGALHIRWRFVSEPPAASGHVVQSTLRPLMSAAAQAGVELRFDDHGRSWCLTLFGYAEALPLVLRDVLAVMGAPTAAAFIEGQRTHHEAATAGTDEMLLRQLLRRLPLRHKPPVLADGVPASQQALAQAWQRSSWDALAIGLPPHLSGPLQAILAKAPGTGAPCVEGHREPAPRYQWARFGEAGVETALALFCPLPTRTAGVEAAWRLLAKQMEPAFFRRLRSELQLGYAVFCGFRSFGEQAGIVFAVQSPSASAEAIVEHIEAFLETFASSISASEPLQCGPLANPNDDLRSRAESIWQARLAGLDVDHPAAVIAASAELDTSHILAQLEALRAAQGGWQVVANADAPDPRWQLH